MGVPALRWPARINSSSRCEGKSTVVRLLGSPTSSGNSSSALELIGSMTFPASTGIHFAQAWSSGTLLLKMPNLSRPSEHPDTPGYLGEHRSKCRVCDGQLRVQCVEKSRHIARLSKKRMSL